MALTLASIKAAVHAEGQALTLWCRAAFTIIVCTRNSCIAILLPTRVSCSYAVLFGFCSRRKNAFDFATKLTLRQMVSRRRWQPFLH